jgi:ribosomal protein S18 acetylase RimI-like enzyme
MQTPADFRQPVTIRQADLARVEDQQAILNLLDEYARQLIGRQAPLSEQVRQDLIPALRAHPTSFILLAAMNEKNVGLATCFTGFSTFKAKPLLNLHDLVVLNEFQNQGIGSQLLDAVCTHARNCQYCAVTLEVRADNPARRLYLRRGFSGLNWSGQNTVTLFAKLELV